MFQTYEMDQPKPAEHTQSCVPVTPGKFFEGQVGLPNPQNTV